MAKRAVLNAPGGVRREIELVAGADGDEILVSSVVPSQGTSVVVVICPGLFNDLPRNHRREFLVARALGAAGVAATRFDYAGTANSGRTERRVTFQSMLADAQRVIRHLRETLDVERVAFLGTRLGAVVAAASAQGDPTAPLAVWDPVIDGDQYLRDGMRAVMMSHVRRAAGPRVTSAELARSLDADGYLDLLGYTLDRDLRDSITGLTLTDALGSHPRAVMLAQFSRRPKLRTPYEELVTAWRSRGLSVTTFVFEHDEAWWFNEDVTRVDDGESKAEPLVQATAKWFATQLLPGIDT